MNIDYNLKLDFDDVLLKPNRSSILSRLDVDLTRTFNFKYSKRTFSGIPIISSNMISVTTSQVAIFMNDHKMLSCKPKSLNWKNLDDSVIMSVGLIDPIPDTSFKFLCVDVPNAYLSAVADRTKRIRDKFGSDIILAVGNVVTAEGVEALIHAGADIVKIGIGSGAACSTRIKTGVGYPQLSAVIECAEVAHSLGGHIISDGGCRNPSDIVKALAAGGDFVMLGSILAGHDENGQDFYGSSSERANNETAGGLKDYRAAEGWELKLPPKGPIEATLLDIEGGLRSACSYLGCSNLEDISKCATFILVGRQANDSLREYMLK